MTEPSGVITASASSLSEKQACGITAECTPSSWVWENAPGVEQIFDHPDDSFDMDLVTEEILNVARQGVKDHPEIGAIVLECTDLPPSPAASGRNWTFPCSTSTP